MAEEYDSRVPGNPRIEPNADNNSKKSRSMKTSTVKDAISKSRTATGLAPDKIIINPVLESVDTSKAVIAFGRHQPFTNGHKKVLDTVEKEAADHSAQAHFITSHSEGTGKNPILASEKVKYIKKVAKPSTRVYSSDSEHPSLLYQLSKLHHDGVRHITYVGGSDRVGAMLNLIKKYNGVKGKHGYFKFDNINSVSSGHRDPDAEGTEGVSGTKVRALARSGDIKGFKTEVPKELHSHAKEIMNHIKSIKEELEILEFIEEMIDTVLEEDIDRFNTHLRDWGTTSLTDIYKNDTPGQVVDAKFKLQFKDPKGDKEAASRSGNPKRKEMDLVPRMDLERDRHKDSSYFRQQSIVKKTIDEKFGKAYKSPWSKIEKAKPGIGKRIDAAVTGLKQNAADYQAILDKEAAAKNKTNESFSMFAEVAINSSGGGGAPIRGMGYVSGSSDNDSPDYTNANIANADTHDNIMAGRVQDHVDLHAGGSDARTDDEITSDLENYKTAALGPKQQIGTTIGSSAATKVSSAIPPGGTKYAVAKEETIYEIGDTSKGQYRLQSAKLRATARAGAAAGESIIGHWSPDKVKKNNKVVAQASMRIKPLVMSPSTNAGLEEDATTEKDPLKHLEDRLNTATDISHNGVDKIMRNVAKDFDMDVHTLHDMWVKKYKITPDQYVKEDINEDLRQWFKDKWVRMDTKGNIKGDCAREPGEGKPKCLPIAKARAMDKDDRAAAVRRKRREDPVADRSGKGSAPINVQTKAANPAQQAAIAIALIKAGRKKGKNPGPQKEEVEHLEEKSKPTNPTLWSRAKALAKSKFDVYPSAYANGWAAKWYKSQGGGWKSINEDTTL
jgi:hypothetical protein